MRITKYPQSCFMIETAGKIILVDPGSILYDSTFQNEWAKADFILITHKHSDHCYAEVIKNFSAKIYSSAEVQNIFPELKINMVKAGDKLHLADGVDVEITTAIHGYLPTMRGANEVYENIGFIVVAEDKRVYFTSDTICFKNDYKCDVLCIATNTNNPMTPLIATLFAQATEAKLVIPSHFDAPRFLIPNDITSLETIFRAYDINYSLMNIKDSMEINI